MTPLEGTVTVLFTDIEGSTQLRTRVGDAGAHHLLEAIDSAVVAELQHHGGQSVKPLGDGFLACFSSARQAITCAVAIQRSLATQRQGQRGTPPGVRIGINSGEVMQGAHDLQGEAINAAARIAGKASGGQILVSAVVKQLVRTMPEVTFTERGRYRLKGFDERWQLFEVGWQEVESTSFHQEDRTPYVGRTQELESIGQQLDRSLDGNGGMVMIGGEPGIGKTRLCDEIADRARDRGFWVLRGRCFEMAGGPPYAPFLEILETALAESPSKQAFLTSLGDSAVEVARIMPRLRRLFPEISDPIDLPPEQERQFLLSSVGDFIARSSRRRPLLLVLDDLQWADDASLLLLRYLAARLPDLPVLVLAIYRDTDLEVSRPLAGVLTDMLRMRRVARVSLKRLPESEVGAMIGAMARQKAPRALVAAIYDEAEGNPFFVEEVFRHLAEEGRILDQRGRFLADLQIGDLDIPSGVRLAIGRRLERLSENAREVLTAAAVLGRSFDYRLLEALEQVNPTRLVDAMDEAERIHLVTTSADSELGDQFSFAHELIRQTLLAGVSLPRRRQLHGRIATAMEQVNADSLAQSAAEISHHLLESGDSSDPGRVVRFLLMAGDHALAAAAFEDALRHLERAAAYEIPEEPTRAEVLRRLGSAQRSLGLWEEALASWDQALLLFEKAGDSRSAGALCSALAQQLAWATRWGHAVQIASRGLAILGETRSADRARLLGMAGVAFGMAGDAKGGGRMLNEAHALAEEVGDREAVALVEGLQVAYHWAYYHLEQSIELGTRAAMTLREHKSLWDLANLLGFVVGAAKMKGEAHRVKGLAAELEILSARMGNMSGILAATRARTPADLGQAFTLEQWNQLGHSDLDLFAGTGSPLAGGALTRLGNGAFWAGDWERALDLFARSALLEPPGVVGGFAPFLHLCEAYLGQKDLALAWVADAQLPVEGSEHGHSTWTAILVAAELLAVVGEREKSAALYPMLTAALRTGAAGRLFDGRLVQALAAISAAEGGRRDLAEEHFGLALSRAETLPNLIEQAETRRWYAQYLLEWDGPGSPRADSLLSEALSIYQKLGMPRHEQMALQLRRGRVKSQAGPD